MNKIKEQYKIKHNKFIKTFNDISRYQYTTIKRSTIIRQIRDLPNSVFIKLILRNIDTLNEFNIGLFDLNIGSRLNILCNRENIRNTVEIIRKLNYIDENSLNFLSNGNIKYDDISYSLRYINDIKLALLRDMPVLESQNAIEHIDLEVIQKLKSYNNNNKEIDNIVLRTQSVISRYLFDYFNSKDLSVNDISTQLYGHDCYFAFKLNKWDIKKLRTKFDNGTLTSSLYGKSFIQYSSNNDIKEIFFNEDNEAIFPRINNLTEFLRDNNKTISQTRYLYLNKFLCEKLNKLHYFDSLLEILYTEYNKNTMTNRKAKDICIIANDLYYYSDYIKFNKKESGNILLLFYLMYNAKFKMIYYWSKGSMNRLMISINNILKHIDLNNFIKNIDFNKVYETEKSQDFIAMMSNFYKSFLAEASYEVNIAFIEKISSVVGMNNEIIETVFRKAKNINDEVISKCSGINSKLVNAALKNKRIKVKDKTYLKLISNCG